jgi:hypothetical protein
MTASGILDSFGLPGVEAVIMESLMETELTSLIVLPGRRAGSKLFTTVHVAVDSTYHRQDGCQTLILKRKTFKACGLGSKRQVRLIS